MTVHEQFHTVIHIVNYEITCYNYYQCNLNALADLGGGACRAHASPYGTQFFHFHIHFHQKVPVSEVHAPPNGCMPPYGISWICH